MATQTLESFSNERLRKWKSISTFALFTVWIGACIAITASLYRLYVYGEVTIAILVVSLLALLASVPTYVERKKIEQELNRREGYIF